MSRRFFFNHKIIKREAECPEIVALSVEQKWLPQFHLEQSGRMNKLHLRPSVNGKWAEFGKWRPARPLVDEGRVCPMSAGADPLAASPPLDVRGMGGGFEVSRFSCRVWPVSNLCVTARGDQRRARRFGGCSACSLHRAIAKKRRRGQVLKRNHLPPTGPPPALPPGPVEFEPPTFLPAADPLDPSIRPSS